MSDLRLTCIVPFCRRSRKVYPGERYGEWCCAVHWPLAPRTYKRVLFRASRRMGRAASYAQFQRLVRLHNLAWEKIKRIVIERAVGVSG